MGEPINYPPFGKKAIFCVIFLLFFENKERIKYLQNIQEDYHETSLYGNISVA